MKLKRTATIRDVATAAGVSTATVSKFVNGTQSFSPNVEAKIRDAIDKLGYQSNPFARGMITGQSGTVGMVILDLRNPHFTNVVRGANRIALQAGYHLLLVDTEESQARERELLETLSRRVDGLIVSSRMPEHAFKWLLEQGKPAVFFGRMAKLGIHSVGSDSYRAAFMLTRHLLELGHKRIAYISFPAARWDLERRRGLTDCLKEAGLQPVLHEADAPTA